MTLYDLRQTPLPPTFKVLVYGNSHLRQVVEAMMCMFHEKVKTQRVMFLGTSVFANQGNLPVLSHAAVLAAAAELHEASVPFFWLNQYQGGGDVGTWGELEKSRFEASGAKHVRIDAMTRGMDNLTKGAVENNSPGDLHFCLPGPPDEMALLLLKMMWAIHFETK
eukprot:g16886.t1